MESDEEQNMSKLTDCIKGYVEANHTTSLNHDASNLISLIGNHSQRALLETCRNVRNKFDYGLVHVAATAGHIQVLRALSVKLSDDDYLELLLIRNINDETPIIIASGLGNLEILTILMGGLSEQSCFTLLQLADGTYGTAVHHAALNNHSHVIDYVLGLISKDLATELLLQANVMGIVPLHWAVLKGHIESITSMLDIFGAPGHAMLLEAKDKHGVSVMLYAVKNEEMRVTETILNKVSSDLRSQMLQKSDKSGNTSLHHAACNRHPEVMNCIIKSISQSEMFQLVQKANQDDQTPLHLAASKGNVEVMRTIIDSLVSHPQFTSLLQAEDDVHGTILHQASQCGSLHAVICILKALPKDERRKLIKSTDAMGMTALHWAAHSKQASVFGSIQTLLSQEEWVELLAMKDGRGESVMHTAAINWCDGILENILGTVTNADWEMLLNLQDAGGKNPDVLLCAACKDNLFLFKATMNSQVDIASVSSYSMFCTLFYDGKSLLHTACCNGSVRVVEYILESLPPERHIEVLQQQNHSGHTALHFAIESGGHELVELFTKLVPEENFMQLLQCIGKVETPLQAVAMSDNVVIAKCILDSIPVDKRIQLLSKHDHNKQSTLHFAVRNANADMLSCIVGYCTQDECIQLLNGADIDSNNVLLCALKATSGDRRSPLSNSSRKVSLEVIQCIMNIIPADQRFSYLMKVDGGGRTGFHIAAQYANPDIMAFLLGFIPADQRITAAELKDEHGLLLLHHASLNEHTKIAKTVLDTIPTEEHVRLLLIEDEDGVAAIHLAFFNIDMIKCILETTVSAHCLLNLLQKPSWMTIQKSLRYQNQFDIMVLLKVFELFPDDLQFMLLKVRDDYGGTILHCLCELSHYVVLELEGYIKNCMDFILQALSSEQRIKLLLMRDQMDRTCLHRWSSSVDISSYVFQHVMKLILELVPADQRIQLLLVQDASGMTILHCLCEHDDDELEVEYIRDNIEYILQNLTSEQCIQLLLMRDKRDRTFLHCLFSNKVKYPQASQDQIKQILELVLVEQRIQLVFAQDESGMTILHCLCAPGRYIWSEKEYNKDIIGYILRGLPSEQRMQLLLAQDKRARTFLHCLSSDKSPQVFRNMMELILKLVQADQCIQLLLAQDENGLSILHCLCELKYDGELEEENIKGNIEYILQPLPPEQRIQLLVVQDKRDRTFLHSMAVKEDITPQVFLDVIRLIQELVPGDQHYQILRIQDNRGRTCLHYMSDTRNPDLMKSVLIEVQTDDRIQLLVIQDVEKKTALHCVFEKIFRGGNIDVFMKFLQLVPAEHLTKLLHINDQNGNTILHHFSEIDSLVQCLNRSDGTLLDSSLQNEWNRFLVYLVHLVPDDHLAQLLCMKERSGNTLLHQVFLQNEGFVKRMFALMPEDTRLDTAIAVLASSNSDHQSTYPNKLSSESRSLQQSKYSGSSCGWLIVLSLQLSVQNSQSEILRKVLKMILVDDQTYKLLLKPVSYGQTALQNAIDRNQTEQIQCIVNCLGNAKTFLVFKATRYLLNRTVLHQAALLDHTNLLRVLLDSISQKQQLSLIRVKDNEGLTAMDEAKASGSEGSVDILEEYLTDARVEEALTEGDNLVQEVVKDAPLTTSHIQKLSEKSRDYIIPRNHRKTKCFGLLFYNREGRVGATQEADILSKGLQATCSNVLRVVEWVDALELVGLIVENLEEIHLSDCCLLTVCIMSHGAPGMLKGRGRYGESSVPINDVLHALKRNLPGHLPMVVLIQACQPYRTYDLPSTHKKKADANRTSAPGTNNHVVLDRPHTALLLATVQGGYAIRGHFTGAMADQFLKADGQTEIHEMFTQAASNVKTSQEGPLHQQPEFRSTLSKRLCLYSSRLKKASSKKRKRESKSSLGISNNNNASTSSSAKQTKFGLIENKNNPIITVDLTEET